MCQPDSFVPSYWNYSPKGGEQKKTIAVLRRGRVTHTMRLKIDSSMPHVTVPPATEMRAFARFARIDTIIDCETYNYLKHRSRGFKPSSSASYAAPPPRTWKAESRLLDLHRAPKFNGAVWMHGVPSICCPNLTS